VTNRHARFIPPFSSFIIPFALLIAILAVSTASIFIKKAQDDAPSLVIAAYRLTFASLVLAPTAWLRHRHELTTLRRDILLLSLLSGAFLAVHFATWISSLEFTSVSSSVVLVCTSPLWVALLSPLLLHERLSKAVFAGAFLALIGSIVTGLGDSCTWQNILQGQNLLACPSLSEFVKGKAFLGNSLALAGAWAVTGYLIIGRRIRAHMSLIPYISLVYGMAAIILIVIMFAAGKTPFGYKPLTYLWMLLLALVPQLIGHSTYNWALRYLPATFIAVATLGEPVGATILAYFILKESPTLMKIIGGTLILAGIYAASRYIETSNNKYK